MDAAIANGEIEVVGRCSWNRIELRELAEVAVQRWPLVTIEEALGREAASILPPGLRTRKFTVLLPRYQIGALEVLAEDGREPVEAMLMRMFEELTDLHHERLARVIPGLWPARPTALVGIASADISDRKRHFRDADRNADSADAIDMEVMRNVLTSIQRRPLLFPPQPGAAPPCPEADRACGVAAQ